MQLQLQEKKWFCRILLFAGAIFMAFTVSYPFEIGFLGWIALIPSAIVILRLAVNETVGLRRMYVIGLLFFWCYYAAIFQWFLALYPMEFTGMSKSAAAFVVLIAMFGLSFLQALFSGVSFVLLALAARSRAVKRFPLMLPFLSAAVWVLAEWFQTVGWWGVPWGRLAISQTAWLPAVQSASLFGSYFVSFLLLIVNFLIAFAILHRKEKQMLRVSCIVAAGLFVVNLAVGMILLSAHPDGGETHKVAAVQGNISSQEKWDDDSLSMIMETYRKYSVEAAKEGAELIVWPETALPKTLSASASLQEYVRSVAAESGAILMIGAFDRSEDGLDENAVYTVYPDGRIDDTVYVKRHLVPFGEYVPLRGFVTAVFPPLAKLGMLEDDLAVGNTPAVVDIDGFGKVGSIICFDSIYETLTRDSVLDGAELIVLPTNDSWFRDSTALRMHNAQAVLRSVESDRYLVRAANTGISSIICPTGEIKEQLGAMQSGYIVSEVCLRDGLTLYTRIGNLFVWLCMAYIGGLIAFRVVDTIRKRRAGSAEKTKSVPDNDGVSR